MTVYNITAIIRRGVIANAGMQFTVNRETVSNHKLRTVGVMGQLFPSCGILNLDVIVKHTHTDVQTLGRRLFNDGGCR